MVPEAIDWEAVRCVSIEGTTIRFFERETQHEIIFPDEETLQAALSAGHASRKHSPHVPYSPRLPVT